MEGRPDLAGLVQGCDAKIDRFGLIVHTHVERRSAGAAKGTVSEAARSDPLDRLLTGDEGKVVDGNASENHGRRAAAELAGPAVTPARVEWLAVQPEAHGSA
jgi:hypothetical protein